jgi:hypothetical protein
VLYYSAGGMVHEDKTGGWERVEHVILRYQKGDTLQYLFDNYSDLDDYPREIRSPYVCYMPKKQSGVLGVHAGRGGITHLWGKSVLPLSEMRDYRDMESSDMYYIPLYQYQIYDSTIRFHKMTQEERTIDTTQIYSTIYAKGKWWFARGHMRHFRETEIEPDVQMIFHEMYDVVYKYLTGSDTILQHHWDLYYEGYITTIPMFHLPMEIDVYYRKNRRDYLVKKRLGFFPPSELWENKLDDYRHEIDTALLALPIRIFQEKYLQTEDIYCLDELNIYYKQK